MTFVSFDATLCRVVINLAATGYSGTGVATVQRSTDQLRWTTVRGCSATPISGTAAAAYDYEFTPGVPNFYRVQASLNANPGFEANASSWTASGGASLSQYGTWAHSGSYSGVFHGNGSTANPAVTTEKDTVSAGDNLTFAPWVYSPQGWGTVQCSIQWFSSGGTQMGQQAVSFAVQAGQPVQSPVCAATIPTGATKASATVQVTGTPASSVLVALDDASLSGGSAATYTDHLTPDLGGMAWLKNIRYPFLNTPVKLGSVGDITRASRGSAFNVIGRREPVAITSQRGARAFSIVAKTASDDATASLNALLDTGDTVFLQAPPDYPAPVGGYYSVGDTTESMNGGVWPARWITLPLTEVAAPGPDVIGVQSTWQTVINTYATWADLIAAQATWQDVVELVGQPADAQVY